MFKDENRHYSLRKLSIGLASVLIGISFASGMNSNSVKADTVKSDSNDTQTVVKGSDAATKIDAKDDANVVESNTESAPEATKKDPNAIAQDIKQKAIKASEDVTKMQNVAETIVKGNAPEVAAKNATDGSQAAAESTLKGTNLIAKQQNTTVKGSADAGKDDSSNVAENDSFTAKNNALKATVEAAKQGLETPVVPHSDSNETALNAKGSKAITENMLKESKTEVKDRQVWSDPAKSKLKLAALLTTTGKKFNAQMLSASKVVSPTKDTNDAFALDSKNGLHEHANVNDNGGYDKDYWGKINVDDWNYTVSGDRIEINSLKDSASTGANDAVIVPNLEDFKLAGKDGGAKAVYISGYTLGKTVKHKYYGLSKTNGSKFVTDSSLAFKFYNDSNLTHADLNSLDTDNVTDMSYMFSGASSLTDLDVSNWDTSNVTNMNSMFSGASSLTSLDVSKWKTGNVTEMMSMFNGASSLTSLDVSKWKTGNVTEMMSMFNGASSLTSLDVSKWKTGNVTNMSDMFYGASGLTDLDVSNWDTGKVTDMHWMFYDASGLTSLDVSNWNTGKVTNMSWMFEGASSLTTLDVSNWDTSKATNMSGMFSDASGLTTLDVSNWDTGKVTDMHWMFYGASGLTSLNVSNWNTGKVTNMSWMFEGASSLALIANSGKFADYLVNHDSFANSKINSGVKSVTTDNTKLLQLLTNDSQHDSATRTVVFTFPANYSPDLAKYHLTKTGNTYQIKQSADYDKPYLQGTVLINATDNIAKHHIDTTEQYKLSDTWQPNYDKLVLAHKNSDGSVSFDAIQLPKIPGYKARINNPNMMLFSVSFMALPKPVTSVQNDAKPAKTVATITTTATEVAKPIKIEPKVATTLKVIDLSDDAVSTTSKEATWQVANNLEHDTYHVSNGKYTVELPHISNAQLHVIANDSTKDSVLFTYKGQNTKYVFNIKFVNGHYLLTTYEIKSSKLVKLIDYNFIKSSKMIDTILDWLKR